MPEPPERTTSSSAWRFSVALVVWSTSKYRFGRYTPALSTRMRGRPSWRPISSITSGGGVAGGGGGGGGPRGARAAAELAADILDHVGGGRRGEGEEGRAAQCAQRCAELEVGGAKIVDIGRQLG